MREYLFHGKCKGIDKWVEGTGIFFDGINTWLFSHDSTRPIAYGMEEFIVEPESVGQYTGMNEFVLTDESRDAKLFEGDIVEVWGWRSVYGRNQSQYDKRVKVRGVIRLEYGQWRINYNNKYNESIAQLKGSETEKRQAHGACELYYYGYRGSDIEKHRAKELEWHRKYHNNDTDIVHMEDIKKIGTVYENADLLEG